MFFLNHCGCYIYHICIFCNSQMFLFFFLNRSSQKKTYTYNLLLHQQSDVTNYQLNECLSLISAHYIFNSKFEGVLA